MMEEADGEGIGDLGGGEMGEGLRLAMARGGSGDGSCVESRELGPSRNGRDFVSFNGSEVERG